MTRKMILSTGAVVTLLMMPVTYGALISNGGFETGDFTGWTVTTNGNTACESDWQVGSSGAATNCLTVSDPLAGQYAAYNSWSADDPKTFILSQDFVVPQSETATLGFSYTYAIDAPPEAINNRWFHVDLNDGATLIDRVFGLYQGGPTSNVDWTEWSFGLSTSLDGRAGEILTIAFSMHVLETADPGEIVGPAGWGLDGVSLVTVPIPAAVWLFGSALGLLGWMRRKKA